MTHWTKSNIVLIGGAILAMSRDTAWAVEGGLGRPITGQQILPFAGYVPPEPGLALSFSSIYYDGSISGDRQAPIAGELAVGLEAQTSLSALTAVYVWTGNTNGWNFASAITLPVIWLQATAEVTVGDAQRSQRDSDFGFWDFPFTPIIAGYNFDALSHLSFSVTIFAPTGSYEDGRLANLGMNVWTFTPTLAFTKFWPKAEVEFSVTSGVGIYTENDETDYKSGALWNLDALVLKRFKNGFGVGAVGGVIAQLTDDTGPLADRLDGFRGHSFGLGPLLSYSRTVNSKPLEMTLRWVPEFGSVNRLSGNGFMFTASYKF